MLRDKKNKKDFIVCIVGKSAVGKTTVVHELERKYNYSPVDSYTTRLPRWKGERGHTFISHKEYDEWDKDEFVAYTMFDSNHYFCTMEQIINSQLYTVDPKGIKYLKDKLANSDIKVITININVSETERIERLNARGETRVQIEQRIKNDDIMFKDLEFDYSVVNNNVDLACKIIDNIIKQDVGYLQVCKLKLKNKWNKIMRKTHFK